MERAFNNEIYLSITFRDKPSNAVSMIHVRYCCATLMINHSVAPVSLLLPRQLPSVMPVKEARCVLHIILRRTVTSLTALNLSSAKSRADFRFTFFFPLATVKMSGSYVVGGEDGLITRYYVRAVLSLRVCAK